MPAHHLGRVHWAVAGGGALLSVAVAVAVTMLIGQHRGPQPVSPPAAIAAMHTLIWQSPDLGRAGDRAVRDCLHGHGFDPPVVPLPGVGSVANMPVFLTAASARRDGYDTAITRIPSAAGPLDQYESSLPGRQRAQFTDALDEQSGPQTQFVTPGGWQVTASRYGCLADARGLLYGSVDNWLVAFALPQDLNSVAYGLYQDQRIAATIRAYATCMHSAGYPVTYPADTLSLATTLAQREYRGGSGTEPGPREVALALADAGCQQATDLRDTYMAAFDKVAASWLASNQTLIERAADIVDRAAASAARLAARTAPVIAH